MKRFIDEQSLIEDSFRLGVQVYESGFRPSFITGIWRGGSAVGIYVQECLQTLGVKTDHISLRTSYDPNSSTPRVRVHGTQYLLETLNADDGLLIVDDVFNTGRSIEAVIKRLQQHLKRNMPRDVRVATLWEHPSRNQTLLKPDYSLHKSEDWLVFPYELVGLSAEEIDDHKGFVRTIEQEVFSTADLPPR